ncbi:hypothetical protein [Onishia niordana]|uniref:hypothetical protein n=1 Tax=Onishia niordana TaxID=2508711 RepID=UPI00197B002C|nr:hypothetical protein [Halomonas niordiana]
MIQKLSVRFDQLETELHEVEKTKHTSHGEFGSFDHVDQEQFDAWKIKAKSLIGNSCGSEGEHLEAFRNAAQPKSFDSSYNVLKRVKPVFLAAKDDFQGGFLISVKNLVQAELFDSELDQARELLTSGYKGPSAVVSGVVLETALRDLCVQNNLSIGKIDKMNADLAKAGLYNLLQQKRITAMADIRNKAAHGDWQGFTDDDVSTMIRDVESFLGKYLV